MKWYGEFCIDFINFMLNNKSLTVFNNLFGTNSFASIIK